MKRLEELTLKWLDDVISHEERAELEALLDGDPAARQTHADFCAVEAALRSRVKGFDVAQAAMLKVQETDFDHTPAFEDDLLDSPPINWCESKSPRPPTRSRSSMWRMVLAASVLLAVGIGGFFYLQQPIEVADAHLGLAKNEVSITRNGVTAVAAAGLDLQAGDVVNVPEHAVAAIHYDDGTRITLGPQTQVSLLELTRLNAASKYLELQRGTLTAHVKKQTPGKSLQITTPFAKFQVLGTRFTLQADAEMARLDVIEGQVRASGMKNSTVIDVEQGQYAVAETQSTLAAKPVEPRISKGLITLYRFDEGEGDVVHDVSQVAPPLDLHLDNIDGADWLPGGGLRIGDSAMLSSTKPAKKIIDACRKSGEMTVEAWLKPTTASQSGPARIVTLSNNTSNRNFTLGHGGDDELVSHANDRSVFIGRVRTSKTTTNGIPELTSADNSVAADLAHVVYTRSADGKHHLYIDGIERASGDRPGDFSTWDKNYRLTLGNELTRDRPWQGEYFLVAVYSRALSPDETKQNFRAGHPAAPIQVGVRK
ncbi:LamG-like jellyroll fold domain-containing protein [Novipirellula rosea]|uniref:FecR protein domain-containing protein n=1 Tax=Novipirellula rosea TaxID=1031540 RepID=A0ABP8NFP9_9BACT